MRATTDSMLEALQEEEHRATLRMHELEQILSDGSGSNVKRSKTQVELSQLGKKVPHLIVGHGEASTQSQSSSAVAGADALTVYDEEAPPTIPQDQMPSAGDGPRTISDAPADHGEANTQSRSSSAVAGADASTVFDEEAPPTITQDQPMPSAGDGPRTTPDAPASNIEGSTMGLERGLEIIDDEEAPPLDPHLAQASTVTPKKVKMKGSIEQSPDSDAGPMRGAQAASAHDVSLTKKMKQATETSNVKLSTIDDSTAPNSDELAALSHDDSLDKSKAKQMKMNTHDELDRIHEADLDRDSDAQPVLTLPRIFARHSTESQEGVDSTQGHERDENLITAYVHTTSPYINESDEICIPTATAVDDDKIPAAEVIHPDKYSLTIAGRKIHLQFLALGALVVLGAIVAMAVTLSKKTAVQPSSAPSVSMVPSLTPFAGYCNWGPDGTAASSVCDGDVQGGEWCNLSQDNCEAPTDAGCAGNWCTNDRSINPTSTLQAEFVEIISVDPTTTLKMGTCGDGTVGNGLCEDSLYPNTCCSRWGWCGTTTHCTSDSNQGTCGGGNRGNGICPNANITRECCSLNGECGTSTEYCNSGFCNWGDDGTAGTATCDKFKGGIWCNKSADKCVWCNKSADKCENDCSGKWCYL